MPYRKTIFAQEEVYHIINRGVGQNPIFTKHKDYQRFLEVLEFYLYSNPPIRFSYYNRLSPKNKKKFIDKLKKNHPPLVKVIAFCLMPNHFHLLLRQNQYDGILQFMKNLQNSYARYFNTKYERKGHLFQWTFKAVHIETEEQLLHVSRYIHLNPSTSYIVKIKDLPKYSWSSLPEYLDVKKSWFTNTDLILSHFKNRKTYRKFVFDQASYQRRLAGLKHLFLEDKP